MAVSRVANPYSNLDLKIPKRDWEAFRRYTTTFRPEDGTPPDIDRSPFDRYVDLWWAALIVGIRNERRTTLAPSDLHGFITGVVFNQDPWRIRQLELIAIAETDGTDVLDNPGEVIAIANEYAATGVSDLIDRMTGQTEPIWAVSSVFRTLSEDDLGSGPSQ